VRIDHFRGFDAYWAIPSTCPTAVGGGPVVGVLPPRRVFSEAPTPSHRPVR